MAKQDTFSAEEWTLARLAPSMISGGIADADPSGIFASIKEVDNSGLGLFAAGCGYGVSR
jgi:hypothetical protein